MNKQTAIIEIKKVFRDYVLFLTTKQAQKIYDALLRIAAKKQA